jgi:hypothetical protein
MATVSFLVFAAALGASVWVMLATMSPRWSLIVDLLVNGPVALSALPAPVAARNTPRAITVRRVSTSPSGMRAAA